jgi:hypothetical protein
VQIYRRLASTRTFVQKRKRHGNRIYEGVEMRECGSCVLAENHPVSQRQAEHTYLLDLLGVETYSKHPCFSYYSTIC